MRGTKTTYNGVTFRSLIERAWAEWFDGEGFHWLYEPVQFRDPKASEGKGYTYTPDFQIDTIFVECKADGASNFNNWHYCPHPLIITFGTPARFYALLHLPERGVIRGHHTRWSTIFDLARLGLPSWA